MRLRISIASIVVVLLAACTSSGAITRKSATTPVQTIAQDNLGYHYCLSDYDDVSKTYTPRAQIREASVPTWQAFETGSGPVNLYTSCDASFQMYKGAAPCYLPGSPPDMTEAEQVLGKGRISFQAVPMLSPVYIVEMKNAKGDPYLQLGNQGYFAATSQPGEKKDSILFLSAKSVNWAGAKNQLYDIYIYTLDDPSTSAPIDQYFRIELFRTGPGYAACMRDEPTPTDTLSAPMPGPIAGCPTTHSIAGVRKPFQSSIGDGHHNKTAVAGGVCDYR